MLFGFTSALNVRLVDIVKSVPSDYARSANVMCGERVFASCAGVRVVLHHGARRRRCFSSLAVQVRESCEALVLELQDVQIDNREIAVPTGGIEPPIS